MGRHAIGVTNGDNEKRSVTAMLRNIGDTAVVKDSNAAWASLSILFLTGLSHRK